MPQVPATTARNKASRTEGLPKGGHTVPLTGMDGPHEGPLDLASSTRISSGISSVSPGPATSPKVDPHSRAVPGTLQGGSGPCGEESHSSDLNIRRVFQPDICGPEEGRGLAPRGEPKGLEQVSELCPLQDGKHSLIEGRYPERGPHGSLGPKRCLPLGTNCEELLEIPQVPLGGTKLRVSDPPVRTRIGPKDVHETPETSGSGEEEERDQDAHLSGRHPRPRTGGYHLEERPSRSSSDPVTARVHNQHQKIGIRTLTGPGFPRIHDRYKEYDDATLTGQSPESHKGVQAHAESEVDLTEETGAPDWPPVFNPSSHPSSPSPLQGTAENEKSSPQGEPELRPSMQTPPSDTTGSRVVDTVPSQAQWAEHHPTQSQPSDDIGCITGGMGCHLSGNQHRRHVVKGGETTPHKPAGAQGCLSSFTGLCGTKEQHPYSSAHRQYDGDCLHQQEGRHALSTPVGPGTPSMGVSLIQEDHPAGGAHSGQGERGSRQRIEERSRPERLDAPPGGVPWDQPQMGPLGHRSLCGTSQHATPKIFQLQTRPDSRSSRCSEPGVDESITVCLPSFHPPWPGLAEDQDGQGPSGSRVGADMAEPTLVPTTVRDDNGLLSDTATDSGLTGESSGGPSPVERGRSPPPSRLESLQAGVSDRGFSEAALELISAS